MPNLISRRQYNDRRKYTAALCETIRMGVAENLDWGEVIFIVDSKPVKVCQPSRANRNLMGKACLEKAPDFGYCATQALYYFGNKLHAVEDYLAWSSPVTWPRPACMTLSIWTTSKRTISPAWLSVTRPTWARTSSTVSLRVQHPTGGTLPIQPEGLEAFPNLCQGKEEIGDEFLAVHRPVQLHA